MGSFTAESQTLLHHPAEAIYDFVSNPHNWPKTYKGSAGIADALTWPLKVGDSWTELIKVSETFSCRSSWTLIIAERPRKWAIQQVDRIGEQADGTGGVDGITTIVYSFQQLSERVTIFHRSLTTELPRGVRIPDELLIVRGQPAGIDGYHDAVARELDAMRP
ncbi:MAG: SRPBCC family protein [Pseudomonadota bacterium]|nr:SRPBCC family protein [Pseudomonadota bacterium]